MPEKIEVTASALKQVLAALLGPDHHIRELQYTMHLPKLAGVPANPICTLVNEYNQFVETYTDNPEYPDT